MTKVLGLQRGRLYRQQGGHASPSASSDHMLNDHDVRLLVSNQQGVVARAVGPSAQRQRQVDFEFKASLVCLHSEF